MTDLFIALVKTCSQLYFLHVVVSH